MTVLEQYAIFGASGCGRGVMPLARQQLSCLKVPYELVFVDDNPTSPICNGHAVLTYADWLARPAMSCHINIAIANSAIREKLAQRCEQDGVRSWTVKIGVRFLFF